MAKPLEGMAAGESGIGTREIGAKVGPAAFLPGQGGAHDGGGDEGQIAVLEIRGGARRLGRGGKLLEPSAEGVAVTDDRGGLRHATLQLGTGQNAARGRNRLAADRSGGGFGSHGARGTGAEDHAFK